MREAIFVISSVFLLSGCVSSHEFYLMGRRSGVVGTATVPANGHRGGPITIAMGGKEYRGRWNLVETGGSAGFGVVNGYSGSQQTTATGTFVGLPTGGNGSVMAGASDGSTLRCNFYFSEMNLKGSGVCQDNRGETYDLQVN